MYGNPKLARVCFQNAGKLRPECARPRAQRLPQLNLAGICEGLSLHRALLWPGTATLRILKTRPSRIGDQGEAASIYQRRQFVFHSGFCRSRHVTSATMFEIVTTSIDAAAQKLTHLRRFL